MREKAQRTPGDRTGQAQTQTDGAFPSASQQCAFSTATEFRQQSLGATGPTLGCIDFSDYWEPDTGPCISSLCYYGLAGPTEHRDRRRGEKRKERLRREDLSRTTSGPAIPWNHGHSARDDSDGDGDTGELI